MASTKLPARLLDTSAVPALNITGTVTAGGLDIGPDSLSGDLVSFGSNSSTQDVLSLYSNTVTSGTTLKVYQDHNGSSGEAVYIQNDGTGNALRIREDSTDVFVVKSGGNVGIGTASPAQKLEVSGSGAKTRLTRSGSAGTVLEFYNGGTFTGGVQVQNAILGLGGGSRENDLTIDGSTGNVGLGMGTTAATRHLTLYKAGTSQTQIQFQNGDTGQTSGDGFGVGMDNGRKGFLWNYDDQDIYLGSSTNGTQIYVDNTNQRVGIGGLTTNALGKLHVKGATNSIAGIIIEGSGNGDVVPLSFKAYANNGTSTSHGISADPGSDQVNNTIRFGNGTSNNGGGVVVNNNNEVKIESPMLHGASDGNYTFGGKYVGGSANDWATSAMFMTPTVVSGSSSASSTQFLSVYTSGHWGEYAVFKVKIYETYYHSNFREYLCRCYSSTGQIQVTTQYGSTTWFGLNDPSLTISSAVNTGSQHSGTVIYRYDFTLNGSAPYYRTHAIVEIGYGANRYYSSGVSQSTLDGYTNAGKYHFKTLTNAEMRGKAIA